MLGIILTWIGYILLGAATVIGAVLGAAWYLAREINAGHEPSCQCPACQGRRQRQWKARHPAANPDRQSGQWWITDRKPPPTKSVWLSTLELTPGMKVIGKNAQKIFRVRAVTPVPYGYMVALVNALTGAESLIPVQRDKAHHRIWLARRPTGGVE